jgi:glycosyltransferase involved in cell wall biosynthesis
MHGYWAARGLAQKGHKVFVVTNADEVEQTFRIHLTKEDLATGGEYAREFPETSGFVRVHSTQPPDRRRLYYIPMNNPTVTRLAAIATDVIRAEKCEVIFTYYLEPYALAAHLAGLWTGIPYAFKHAGSDLYNLLLLDDLQTSYIEVMRRANRILSSGASGKQLIAYGIPGNRLATNIGFGLPTEYFRPDAPPLDLNAFLAQTAQSNPVETVSESNFETLDPALPILGIYGKLGTYKGSFDLLHAAAKLIKDGFPFYLVAMSNGWAAREFHRLVDELKITEYVRFLPFQPHWRVPSFLRSCTAVAFLERDFPIAAHTPTIPYEVVACGKCLITSEEVARKQHFRTQIRNLKNLIVVPDPKQHGELAKAVRFALEDRGRAEAIGQRGYQDFHGSQSYEEYIEHMENMLIEVAAEKPVTTIAGEQTAAQTEPVSAYQIVSRLFPFTYALLNENQAKRVHEAFAGDSLDGALEDSDLSSKIGSKLLSVFNSDEGDAPAYEVCRYENKVNEFKKKGEARDEVRGGGVFFSIEELASLYPTRRGDFEIVKFTYDVEPMISAIINGEAFTQARRPSTILFHSAAPPFKINGATEYLLGLLGEGSTTVNELLEILYRQYRAGDEATQSRLRTSCLSVLESLYWAGVIEFEARPPVEKNVEYLEEVEP